MATFRVLTAMLVLFAVCVVSAAGIRLTNRLRNRNVRVKNLNAILGRENGRRTFPGEIEADIEVDGLPPKHIRAKLDEDVHTPMIEEVGETVKAKRMKPKDTAYYTGPDGALACRPGKKNRDECDLFGVIYEGNENCLIKDGTAYCAEIQEGVDVVLDPETDEVVDEVSRRKREETHSKRDIVEPSASTEVIRVAMFFDMAMVDRFKSFNGGSYSAAVADLQEYAILLNNELTYRFQTCKLYSNGRDLSVDAVEILYPSNNNDFSFIRKDSFGRLDYSPTLTAFRQNSQVLDLVRDGVNQVAEHAMLFTGLVFDSTNTIGVAYVSTICRSNAQYYRVSIQRDLDYNVANIGAHEIGHALGAGHDGDGNSCNSNAYLLGPSLSGITAATASTYYTFSPCSNDQFDSHLNFYGNCLGSKTADFVTRFCQGPRGRLNFASLDEQCERASSSTTGTTSANACGVQAVTADQCWRQNAFSCCGGSTIQGIADGTPCTGPTSALHYCYLGICTEGDSICGVSVTTTPTTTTTTTPTTTTTTPTATTTTPTTTTTTPTTTTTTPTTTTTTPTTTTTTPTTTTTTPTTTTTTPTTTTTTPTTTTTTPTTTTTTPTTTTTTPTTTTTTPTTTTTTPTTTTTTPTTTTTTPTTTTTTPTTTTTTPTTTTTTPTTTTTTPTTTTTTPTTTTTTPTTTTTTPTTTTTTPTTTTTTPTTTTTTPTTTTTTPTTTTTTPTTTTTTPTTTTTTPTTTTTTPTTTTTTPTTTTTTPTTTTTTPTTTTTTPTTTTTAPPCPTNDPFYRFLYCIFFGLCCA